MSDLDVKLALFLHRSPRELKPQRVTPWHLIAPTQLYGCKRLL